MSEASESYKHMAALFQTLNRYCQSGTPDNALPLFDQMRTLAAFNSENVSMSLLLGTAAASLNYAYGKAGAFGKARSIIQQMEGMVDADGVPVVDTRSLEGTLKMFGG